MAWKSYRRWIVWSLVAAFGLPALTAGGWVVYNRYVSHNFHTVIPGSVYRSGQPLGEDIHRWTDKYGLKTVVNLRGGESDERVQSELAAVAELKLDYYDIHLSNTRLPSAEELRELARVLETARRLQHHHPVRPQGRRRPHRSGRGHGPHGPGGRRLPGGDQAALTLLPALRCRRRPRCRLPGAIRGLLPRQGAEKAHRRLAGIPRLGPDAVQPSGRSHVQAEKALERFVAKSSYSALDWTPCGTENARHVRPPDQERARD